MKYIRTKDRIYEVDTSSIHYIGTYFSCWDINHTRVFNNWHITKKADTIEELCDEFVVAYENGARIVYFDLEWAKTKAKESLEVGNKSVIYGAIWTDKGLIYVAKMNEKGELELI